MSATEVAPATTQRLGVLLLVLSLALAALFAFAAVDSGAGDSRQLFALLSASALVSALGAATAVAAARQDGGGWTGLVVALFVVSLVLLLAAATRDGGTALPLVMLPLLLVQWWVVRALRGAGSDG